MTEYGGGPEYKTYQSWFTDRMVSANKHGVPDVIEEIEEIREDVERVPWQSLTDEEKLSIITPALSSVRTIFDQAAYDGQIDERDVGRIVENFSSLMIAQALGVEENLNDEAFGMMELLLKDNL